MTSPATSPDYQACRQEMQLAAGYDVAQRACEDRWRLPGGQAYQRARDQSADEVLGETAAREPPAAAPAEAGVAGEGTVIAAPRRRDDQASYPECEPGGEVEQDAGQHAAGQSDGAAADQAGRH
jgi:hypothetical protein